MTRTTSILTVALMMAGFAAGPARADGDAAAGKVIFGKCAICHSAVQGQVKIGPPLWGVVGRPSASVTNFNYSDAMKNAHKTWDAATLDVYLTNPRGLVPGTKMIFPGLPAAQDRANLIAYLTTLK